MTLATPSPFAVRPPDRCAPARHAEHPQPAAHGPAPHGLAGEVVTWSIISTRQNTGHEATDGLTTLTH